MCSCEKYCHSTVPSFILITTKFTQQLYLDNFFLIILLLLQPEEVMTFVKIQLNLHSCAVEHAQVQYSSSDMKIILTLSLLQILPSNKLLVNFKQGFQTT